MKSRRATKPASSRWPPGFTPSARPPPNSISTATIFGGSPFLFVASRVRQLLRWWHESPRSWWFFIHHEEVQNAECRMQRQGGHTVSAVCTLHTLTISNNRGHQIQEYLWLLDKTFRFLDQTFWTKTNILNFHQKI